MGWKRTPSSSKVPRSASISGRVAIFCGSETLLGLRQPLLDFLGALQLKGTKRYPNNHYLQLTAFQADLRSEPPETARNVEN